tara:strand:+ start:696 stop:1094 length:399 start_codon:yes stop_codon:yes gene_type:complete
MSATNSRIRRAILDVLWEHGPLTKEETAVHLANAKGVRRVPSPHSLSALLCKSHSIIIVGKKTVENIVGVKAQHALYDLDREIVLSKDEILFVREPSTMTPGERAVCRKCECGRTRVFPEGADECLSCQRVG